MKRPKLARMKIPIPVFAPLLLATALVGCGESTTRLSVLLTDAPGDDIEAAVVTIERVYLQGEQRVTVSDDVVTTDLLDLANAVENLAEEVEVPSGRYHQLRLVISGAYIEVREDGETRLYATPDYPEVPEGRSVDGTLHTPSWDASGLKVKLPGGALELDGDAKVVVVDFDVAESFRKGPAPNDRWVLSPIIDANELTVTGTLHVTLTPVDGVDASLLAHFDARLLDAEGNLEGQLAFTPDAGASTYSATFVFLNPYEGPFELAVVSTVPGFLLTTSTAMPVTVDIDSGARADVDLTVTAILTP